LPLPATSHTFLHRAAADAIHALVQVDGHADVVGDDAQALSDFKFTIRALDVQVAVLLVHFVKDGLGGFDDVAESDGGGARQQIRRKRFGAAIDDDLAGAGGRDDGDQNRGGAVRFGAGAALDGVPVVVDVGTGADFIQAWQLMGVEERRRGAAADDADGDAGAGEIVEDGLDQAAERRQGRVAASALSRMCPG